MPDNASFHSVDAIYFRRTLAAPVQKRLSEIQPASERTILIVRAEALAMTLMRLRLAGKTPLQMFEESHQP